MRRFAVVLAVALAAGCGGAASGRGEAAGPSLTAAPSATGASATVTPAGTVSATAIAATIVPIVPGTTPTPAPPTATPTPTPSPAPGGLTQAQLKYRLVDRFGRLLFCDPDFYPVARADEQAQADQRFPEIQKDAPTFSATLAHLGTVPATHEVVRLALADGRLVYVSPGHPTADGRRVAELIAGDRYDEATVTSVGRVRYDGGATFDILPAGATGLYWANGVLLGSTLH